jgi:hypothetical protein
VLNKEFSRPESWIKNRRKIVFGRLLNGSITDSRAVSGTQAGNDLDGRIRNWLKGKPCAARGSALIKTREAFGLYAQRQRTAQSL